MERPLPPSGPPPPISTLPPHPGIGDRPVADATLLRRIVDRDATALIEMQRRYHGSLYALVYGTLMDAERAERVVNRAFEQLWHAARRLSGGHPRPFAWLQQTASALARAERVALQSR